jgi:predicted nucleic-acid-binding Zn-ribbon protein
MRKSHSCPKCAHDEIMFLPHIADRDDGDRVRALSLHVKHHDWKDDELGQLQAYVCRKCGFTELYTARPDALPIDKIPGAKLLKPKA